MSPASSTDGTIWPPWAWITSPDVSRRASPGVQALEVVARHPELFEVVGLGAGSKREALAEQA
ncbi:hypothetical protein, partial [Clavibacter michiganensis]|uniref:hypothetical protein n=1 Tax=Clavibacter michiganensis TaxID=28447 RepID=UPI00292EAF20